MKLNAQLILLMLTIALLDLACFQLVQAATPEQIFTQYIADLQKNPNDYALREKIIRHVQTMSPAPAVPGEAKKYVNRGVAAGEGAKTESDYKDAIVEFQKAVNLAPWLGAGYRGLAVMQDKAGLYSQAILNLKLFLLTNPAVADAEAAETLMDKIEYRQEKAAKKSSPTSIAEKKQQEGEDIINKLNGVRFVNHWSSSAAIGYATLDIQGNKLVSGWVITRCINPPCGQTGVWVQLYEAALNGLGFSYNANCMSGGRIVNRVLGGKISADGYSVTVEGCSSEKMIYRRER